MNLLLIAIGAGVAVTVFAVFLILSRPTRESMLLAEVTAHAEQAPVGRSFFGFASAETLAKPLGALGRQFGGNPDSGLVHRLMLAGYRKPYHADVFVGSKLILPAAAGLSVAFFIHENVILYFVLAVILGFLVPDFWLNRAITKRRENIQLSLPDTLDLLAICMEAGLGLDQAIVRVGEEQRLSHPEISQELLQINLEQRAGNPRLGAWRAMADRVGLESVRSFVNMLVQTERFGTPISRSLGVYADALRTQRRQRAEELAAKTTIKLVIPLVLLIFPSIFIVTVGPAVITLIRSFSTMFGS